MFSIAVMNNVPNSIASLTTPSTAGTIGNQFCRLYPTPLKPVGDLPLASVGVRSCRKLTNYAFSGIYQIQRQGPTLNFQHVLGALIYTFQCAHTLVPQGK